MDKSTERSVVSAIDAYIRVRYGKVFDVGEEDAPALSKAAAATFDEEIAKARKVIELLGRGEMEAYRHMLTEMELELADNRRTVNATCMESYSVEFAAAGGKVDADGVAAAAEDDTASEAAASAGAEGEAENSIGMRRHSFTVDLTIDGPIITSHEEQEISSHEIAEQLEILKALADATSTRMKAEPVAKPTTFARFMATPKLLLLRQAFGGASLLHISLIVVAALLLLAGVGYTVVPTTTVAECSLQTGSVRYTTTLFGLQVATSQKDSPNAIWARDHVLQGAEETWLPLTTTTRNNAGYMTTSPGHPLAAFIRPNLKTLQGLASREPEAAKLAIERYRALAAEVDPATQTVEGLPDSIYSTRPDRETIRKMPPFAAFSFEKR